MMHDLDILIEEYQKKAKEATIEWTRTTNYNYPQRLTLTLSSGSVLGLRIGVHKEAVHFLPLHDTQFQPGEEEWFSFLLEFVEQYREIKKVPILFAQTEAFHQFWNDPSTLFQSFGYKSIDHLEAKRLVSFHIIEKTASAWIKDHSNASVKVTDAGEVYNRTYHVLKEREENDPILDIGDKTTHSIKFYYEGVFSDFTLSYEHDQFFLSEEVCQVKKPIEHLDDIQPTVEKVLGMIQKKKRLKNLFEPPKYHFEKLMRPIAPWGFLDDIYGKLLSIYSPHEMEVMAALQKKENKQIIASEFHFLLVSFGKEVFVMDINTENMLFYQGENALEEGFSFYQKKVLEELNERMNKQKALLERSLW